MHSAYKVQGDQVLRWAALNKKVGMSRSTIDRWEAENLFPKRIKLGKNSVGWRLSEVENWLKRKTFNL